MKVSSNVSAAEAAVSAFAGIDVDDVGVQVSVGVSNVPSILEGAELSNGLLKHVSDMVFVVKSQANKVTVLASEIEARDYRDAGSMSAAQ